MLTNAQIKAAKPTNGPYKMTDAGGLYVQVSPNGSKLWRYRYEHAGKEKLMALGAYPEVSLAQARARRDDAKGVVREGRDPSLERKLARAARQASTAHTFEVVARDWHARHKPIWTERHAADVLTSLERDVFPQIGGIPITGLTPPIVLGVLRAIEARPAIETAHRVRQRMSAVFVYGIASGLCPTDPAVIVKGALSPVIKGRQPAVLSLEEAREILARAEATPSYPVTRLALRLLAVTAVRPGEVRAAGWVEFEGLDGPEPLWRIPAGRMKMKVEHAVPLARQAVAVIEAVRPLTGRGPLVFPNSRFAHRPMSENAIGYLLNRAGYHSRHVPHGWRATFSTIMNERHPADRHVIDLMLAHAPKDRVEAAYNRAAHTPRRRELAQEWADLLTHEAASASVRV